MPSADLCPDLSHIIACIIITSHQIESRLQRADESDPRVRHTKVLGHLVEEDAEAKHDAIDDEVAHERGEDDDPAPAAVGRYHHLHVALYSSHVLFIYVLLCYILLVDKR